jgi:hypothetical protein
MPRRTSLALTALLVAQIAAAQTVSGSTYTTTLTMTPTGTAQGGNYPDMRRTYVRSTTISAAGRTRTDVDSVVGEGFGRKGEYSISDAKGSVTVQPATKTFYANTDYSDFNIDSALAGSGMKISTKVLKASVDSVGPGERIDGRPTVHYRITLTQSFGIDVSGGGMDPQLADAFKNEVTLIMDHWYADVPNIPAEFSFEDFAERLPLRRGAIGPLAKTMDSLFQKMPKGKLAVRTITTTSAGGAGVLMMMEMKTEITGLKSVPVDPARLAVPDAYKEVADPDTNPMMPGKPATNTGRWKASAWAAQRATKKP